MRFVLASASSGRYETLTRAGVQPERLVSGVDEDAVTAPTVRDLVQELADLKAAAVASQLVGQALVLGCDSLLELDGEPLGKPVKIDVARDRWRRMRGRSGVLHTGHCLMQVRGAAAHATLSTTVHFADVSDDEIELYLSTGEPSNVAGGFTIDGFGGWFVEYIYGDPHNVVGLSLPTLRAMLRELGHDLRDIGYPSYE
jgi:MAF protein